MNKNITLAIAAALALGIAGSASAGTATGTVSPTATVAGACIINSATLDFGTVSGVVQSNVDATGAINLNCTASLPFSISANLGANTAKAKVAGRRAMIAGAAANGLDYDLFADSAYATKMGMGTNPITGTSGGTGGALSVPLYGRIYTGQTFSNAVGVVNDTVALTITF